MSEEWSGGNGRREMGELAAKMDGLHTMLLEHRNDTREYRAETRVEMASIRAEVKYAAEKHDEADKKAFEVIYTRLNKLNSGRGISLAAGTAGINAAILGLLFAMAKMMGVIQ